MNEERKLRAAQLRLRSAAVDPKRIQLSGVLSIVGGSIVVLGTFFTFNTSTIDGLLTISRNAYHMGSNLSDNGVGFLDSIPAVALVVLGVGLLRGYRGYWFNPVKHVVIGVGIAAIVFEQRNYDVPTVAGIRYTMGIGWYMCLAGGVIGVIAAFVRTPTSST